uniref:NLE domain-containing protein n=1 Tax=Meloidogyne incognita TaxID=6306 RepID=A0A914LM84_MELIC
MHVDFETNINQPDKGHFPMNLDKSRLNISVRLFSEDNKELSNAPIVLPSTTKVDQLEQLYYSLLDIDLEDEQPPVHFRVPERSQDGGWIDIVDALGVSLPSDCLVTEKPIELFCLPQAVFRVRPVTRCAASLPGHGEPLISVKFSPNGSTLASGSGDKTVRLWDTKSQLPLQTLTGHQHWVLCIAWSHDGNKIASACKQGIIIIWEYDSETNKFRLFKKLTGHKQWINALAWRPLHLEAPSRLLASAGRDASIRIWDIIKSHTLFVLSGHTASVTDIRWSGNDLIYSGSQDRTIKVWRTNDGVLCRTLEGHAHWINTLASNVDYVLRIGSFSPEEDSKQKQISISNTHPGEAQKIAKKQYEKMLNCQPERLVSGSDDFTLFLWEPAIKKQPIARLTGHQQLINQVQFSPDGRTIASASFDKSIKLWDGWTGKFQTSLRGHVGPVYQIAWSSDSRLLVSGSADSTLKVWNMQKRKLGQDLPGHGDEVFAVDWSPNSECVASGGKDKVLKLWKR